MAGQVIHKIVAGDGSKNLISPSLYCTCNTAAATAAKVAIVNDPDITNTITLFNGLTIFVKFTNANGVANPTITLYNNSGTAASPSQGSTTLIAAKSIKRYGTTAPSTSAASSWTAGSIVALVYDGTNWIECSSWDNNTTYTNMSTAEAEAGTATTARTISAARLWEGAQAAVADDPPVVVGTTQPTNSHALLWIDTTS